MAPSIWKVVVKTTDKWQYGDFQTPQALCMEVCSYLAAQSIEPTCVVEPSCGIGRFLHAAQETWPHATLVGFEINEAYVERARAAVPSAAIHHADFFSDTWKQGFTGGTPSVLFLGNPPWVTNSDLGKIDKHNLPEKTNFRGHSGIASITGKGNFDIAEWMVLQQVQHVAHTAGGGTIAVLIKSSVARKIVHHCWKTGIGVAKASIVMINAQAHFGAAVDACLFFLNIRPTGKSKVCPVYSSFTATQPVSEIGYDTGMLLSDATSYHRLKAHIKPSDTYRWRSGIKHDCADVMELDGTHVGSLYDKKKRPVDVEDTILYGLLKSSDLANGRLTPTRSVLVTQKNTGDLTSILATVAPKSWAYLNTHGHKMDARKSTVYKNKPRFCMFGVGDYAFRPWRVAVSGLYKNILFVKVDPFNGKPVMFDDTVYYLSFDTEQERDEVFSVVTSKSYQSLLRSLVFLDNKRPITVDILAKISIESFLNKDTPASVQAV